MQSSLLQHGAIIALCALTQCGGEPGEPGPSRSTPQPSAAIGTVAQAAAPAKAPFLLQDEEKRTIPNAQAAFARVMALIQANYVDKKIDEDLLWTGAIQGVLDRLIQLKKQRVNALLTPRQIKEMRLGIKGRFSGIGVVIKKLENVVFASEVLSGSPAEKAGIKGGDRFLAIDGKRTAELSLLQIVDLIRGPEGSSVELIVQREAQEWNLPVVRGSIALPAVSGQLLAEDKIGYLRITSFRKRAAEELDRLVAEQIGKGARGFIVDLRGCPGGLLDRAVAVAERFLSPQKTIVTLKRRGGKKEVLRAARKDPADTLPLVVLIGEHTASGAEIVAGALRDHQRAVIVGQPSAGKGTVEKILDLDDGWALKLSIARFFGPSGHAFQGQGVIPDFAIAAPPAGAPRELAKDAQVQAARRLLTMRTGS
ncbi:MAG: S41 family peptidase [Deltaproteobacteria bacterium]|nr:S41 family peptidase [Deltaproteobacteria bacterium]